MADVHNPATRSYLDRQNVFLVNDQPTTCPKCGARTHFEEINNEKGNYQIHSCPRPNCAYAFIAVEDDK